MPTILDTKLEIQEFVVTNAWESEVPRGVGWKRPLRSAAPKGGK